MANGRGNLKGRRDSGRDAGPFVALPWSVLKSKSYLGLSMHARALLIEVALQYIIDKKSGAGNNGRLLLSRAFMAGRGWKSADMLTKAKAELLEAKLIFQTVQGARPNKASWYAITWQRLDKHPALEFWTSFEQGAYRRGEAVIADVTERKALAAPTGGAVLVPPHGTGAGAIGPSHGTEKPAPVPPRGPIKPDCDASPVPPHGHHLEEPSAAAVAATLPPILAVPRKRGPKRKTTIEINGRQLARVPCAVAECPGPNCRAALGEPHAKGCRHEVCPACGSASWLSCRCGADRSAHRMRYLGKSPRKSPSSSPAGAARAACHAPGAVTSP